MTFDYDIPSPEYEQACLREVEKALGRLRLDRDGVVVHGIELVQHGENDKRIVASLTRRGLPRRVEWRLYHDAFNGIPPEGQAEFPEDVGMGMSVWAMGG
jgi:hypothetical protein